MAKNRLPSNILVIRFSALGDVAMTIPVVYSACISNPECRFVFLTRRLPASLFMNPPSNLIVEGIDTSEYEGLWGLSRLFRELRQKYNIDAVADLHDVTRSKVLRFLGRCHGLKIRHINKGRRGKRALTRVRNKVFLPLVSTRMRYREVFHALGLDYKDSFDGFSLDSLPASESFSKASPEKTSGEKWIAVAPFARHPGKIYPLELMEEVVARLSARPGYRIFLLGAGEHESNVFGRWTLKYDNLVNLAVMRLGLPAEMSLMARCDALISMDSANMHLASLVGTRVISVWGATHPYCGFMGWRQKKSDAVQLDMVCRPCSVFGNKPCRFGDFHCMAGIPPALIIETLDSEQV